jgi:hypothetical protein
MPITSRQRYSMVLSPGSDLTSWRGRYLADAGRYVHDDWLRRSLFAGLIYRRVETGSSVLPALLLGLSFARRYVHQTPNATCCRSLTLGVCNAFSTVPACHGRRWTLAWCGIHPSKTRISSTIQIIHPRSSFCCLGTGSRGT